MKQRPMHFDLVRPCADCPFRTDRTMYLGRARRTEISDSLAAHDQMFECHKTTGVGGKRAKVGQHCAGALIMLAKAGQLWNNFRLRLAAMKGLFDPNRLDCSAPVYPSPEAFIHGEDRERTKDDAPHTE